MSLIPERGFHKLFVFAAVVYAVLLLIGPKVTEHEIATQRLWLLNVDLPGPFGISLNKDSIFYMDLANNPAKVFEKGSILQSRPLLPLLVHFPSIALQTVLNHLPGANTDDLPLGAWTGSYLAFLGANVLILAAALLMLNAILKFATAGIAVRSKNATKMAVEAGMIVGFLIIANDLTKAFLYAAHVQMFNILVPLLTVFMLLKIDSKGAQMKDIASWALFIGILNLAYGLSLVSGGAILLLLLNRWREKLLPTKPFLLAFSVTLTFLILPYFLWAGIVVLLTGSFYSHEITTWKQVVWIKDVTHQGLPWLVLKLAGNFWFFVSSMLRHLFQIATIPLLLLYFSIPVWPTLKTKFHVQKKLIGWTGILIPVFFLVFYSVVGLTVSRLAFAGTTLVILLLSLWGSMLIGCLKMERQRIFLFASSFLIFLHSTMLLVKSGPHS